jgi:TonB-linked SusC/RagA family outer membrane protein
MKLSVMFLVIGMLQVSASVYSQGNRVKIKERNIALAELFWKIQSQTDFVFAFSNEDVEAFTNLNVNTEGEIEEILNEILADKGLSFELKNGVYVIQRKAPESKPVVVEEQQEEKKVKITGTVRDENGEPLPFAAVCFKGTTYGCVSAVDGHYVLEAPIEEGLMLEVSSLGYKSQEIEVRGRTVIDIVMVSDMENLDEVVVTGYTKVSKVRATSAAAKVTSESIERQVTVNLDDRMEGLATGLNINAVTKDGGEENIEFILRGTSTFDEEGENFDIAMQARNSLNRQPLIVVDGFPYEGPFNDIDMSTVESIDVLKDAAATALWGLRASNGVIVITTKRGKEGKPRVTFNTNWTFGTKQNLDDFGFASSADEIALRNMYMEQNPTENAAYKAINYQTQKPWWWDLYMPYPFVPEESFYDKYNGLDVYDAIWADFYASGQTEVDVAQRDAKLAALGNNDVLPQFRDKLLRNGFAMNNSVNISGGSNFINYSLTASHTKEEKPSVGDDFERINLSLSTDVKLSKNLSVIADVSLSSSENNRNGIGVSELYTGQYIPRYANIVDDNGNPVSINDVYAPYKEEFLAKGFDDRSYNPIIDQKYRNNQSTNDNLRLATGINYKITNWLTADLKYQYNRVGSYIRNHRPVEQYFMRTRQNSYIMEVDPGDGTGVTRAVPYGERLEKNETINTYSTIRGNLSFNKVFAQDHVVNGIIGMEANENNYSSNQHQFVGYSDVTGVYDQTFDHFQWAENRGTISPDPYLGYGSYSAPILYQPEIKSRTISSFSNFGYSYMAKYNIEASFKVDQATAFGINKKLAKNLYWAVSGSWNIAKENFLQTSNWVEQLKLRASYGLNGNMRRGLTTMTTIRYSTGGDWITQRNYATVASAANPNLAPEQTTTVNLGLDFALFNRLRGSVDVFDKVSTDLLVKQELNASYALDYPLELYTNDGEISNKGIEISLGADIIRKADFKWNALLNYSYTKNEVVKYGERAPTSASSYYYAVSGGRTKVIGEDISVRAFYEWGGLDENGDPTVIVDGEQMSYADPAFRELQQDVMVYSKPFIAPHYGGLTNTFTYKQFTLSALMTYKFGHVFQEDLDAKYAKYNVYADVNAHHKDVANAWTADNTNTDIPAAPRDKAEADNYDRQIAFTLSNYGVHNAAHIRLKDVTLNYQLDPKLTQKVGISRASLMFQVRDLGLIWIANNEGIDPESVPFSGRSIYFSGSFPQAYRPGIRVPVSFVIGAKFEF